MWRIGLAFAAATGAALHLAAPSRYTHVWGNGVYRPRPDHPEDLLNFKNFHPKILKPVSKTMQTPDFVQVSFGGLNSAGIDTRGKLYVWDRPEIMANKQGKDVARNIEPVAPRYNFQQVEFSSKGILFALDSRGDVYQWRYDKLEEPEMRKVLTAEKMVKINAGYDHFACIGASGKVYTMGDDTFGQCGVDGFNRTLTDPYLELRYPNLAQVMLPKKAIDIKCGKQHTVVLLEDNTAMVWGRNNKHQLGSISLRMGNAPAPVAYTPVWVETLEGKKITKIAAGDMFTVFVTENGDKSSDFWGMGLNSVGQLGLGYLTHVMDLTRITGLSGFVVNENGAQRPVGVQQLECGSEHCIALMDVGAVYIWGGNEHGEQGNQKRTVQENPRLIKKYLKKKVKSVHCKQSNSAVIFE